MLSFTNLIEAHVLHAIRRVHKIRMSKVREAMRAIREEVESLHPLAEVDLYTEGKNILVREHERRETERNGGGRQHLRKAD